MIAQILHWIFNILLIWLGTGVLVTVWFSNDKFEKSGLFMRRAITLSILPIMYSLLMLITVIPTSLSFWWNQNKFFASEFKSLWESASNQ